MIAAEGEQKASGALKEAAEVIQQSPHALQVRVSVSNFKLIFFVVILKWELLNCHYCRKYLLEHIRFRSKEQY